MPKLHTFLHVYLDQFQNEKSSNTADLSAPNTPKSGLRLKKKLTPKQKQKRDDMELRRQEREKIKQVNYLDSSHELE